MEDAAFLPDKKRRFLNRSQSASRSIIWSRGGSAANALCPNPSPSRRQDKDKDMDGEEVLGPSPCKKGTFRPLFHDSPPTPRVLFQRTKAKTPSRTNSLPLGMQVFGKKKGDLSKTEEGHVRVQLPTPSSSSNANAGVTASHGKRKRSGSGAGPDLEVEGGVEDRSVVSAAGPIAVLGLIPPSPPATRENERQEERQQQQRLQWKGKGKSATGKSKGKKKAKIVPSEGTSGEEYNAVEELAWKPVGPLKRRLQAADISAEPDLELELEDPISVAHSKVKLVVPVEEPEQEGNFEVDLPDHLKDILTLAPSKRSREDEETIVRNLLAGKREFLSKVEIWAAGEVLEAHGDDDDDDWDGEPVGWWEAEL